MKIRPHKASRVGRAIVQFDVPGDSIVLRFDVPAELAGQRIDRFLLWRLGRIDRAKACEIAEHCARYPDGSKRPAHDRLAHGETLILVRPRFEEPVTPTSFGTIHKDNAIWVLDKPTGLPVHPSASYHRHTLSKMLELQSEPPYRLAHRLDRETSGVMVAALSGAHDVAVKRQFQLREVGKTYVAIVAGRMMETHGTIDLPLRRRASSELSILMEAHANGLPSCTRYEVIEARTPATLVRLWPESGRQHQLRVHLASLGHPIIGDKLYGPEGPKVFLDIIEQGLTDDIVLRLGHYRHALHAESLAFNHPSSAERCSFTAPLPEDLRLLWQRLV